MKRIKQIGAGIATLALATQLGAVTFAKDVVPTSGSIVTVPGPCSVDFADTAPGEIYYPVSNDKYPGTVGANMKITATAITLKSVCLDPGWTVVNQSASNGVQLRYFYNGVKAVDFKFVSGKTDIRSY